jgi:hypothetical protein
MPTPYYSGPFFRVVVATLWLSGSGAAEQPPASQYLELGRFTLGSYPIELRVDGRNEKITVHVGVQHKVSDEIIPADEFQAWMLLKDGKSLPLEGRSPEKGKRPISFRGGGEWSALSFRFESGDPVALVLRVGSQFQVFPITSAIPR